MTPKQTEILNQLKVLARSYQTEFKERLPITGIIGELEACEQLGLHKTLVLNQAGYDAKTSSGIKVQIKSAMLYYKEGYDAYANTYFHNVKEGEYNIMVFCAINRNFELHGLWQIDKKELLAHKEITVLWKTNRIRLSDVRRICEQKFCKQLQKRASSKAFIQRLQGNTS